VYKQFTKVAAREREIYRYSKHFIGRTDWDRRVTKVLAKSAQYYQNDEILRSSFYKFKHHSKLSGRLVLFTTTWTNLYKGLETVFDCANLLDENSVDYEWRIAGLNADDEIVRIAARSTKRSISGNIKFLGMLNEQALVQALLLANIYVAPSHIENSPNSLCEAQILGLPCIATCAGGTSSLLEDHNEGILIQDGDPFAMAGAVMELNENYPRAVMMGENGRERALTRHDPERITGALLEIYDSILASASIGVTIKEDSQLIAKNGDA
jgi:glycosyltransferase involved in cell wall biosynthesis